MNTKRKIIAVILLALIYAFPFRYAFLDLKQPHAFGLICAFVSLFGFLACIYLADTDDEKVAKKHSIGRHEQSDLKQAA